MHVANMVRFITEDPIKDGVNWYSYVSNNPLVKIDPTGLYAGYMPQGATDAQMKMIDPKYERDDTYTSDPFKETGHSVDTWTVDGVEQNEGMSFLRGVYDTVEGGADGLLELNRVPVNMDDIIAANCLLMYFLGMEEQANRLNDLLLTDISPSPLDFEYDSSGKLIGIKGINSKQLSYFVGTIFPGALAANIQNLNQGISISEKIYQTEKNIMLYGDDMATYSKARAKYLISRTGKTPTVTSIVKDVKSGAIYYGESGYIARNIHPSLQAQMPTSSSTLWAVANCAEFNAVNNALLNGAQSIDDLAIYTIYTRTQVPIARCSNC